MSPTSHAKITFFCLCLASVIGIANFFIERSDRRKILQNLAQATENLARAVQERDAWKLTATAAIRRLHDQDRLRQLDAPPSPLWGLGNGLGIYHVTERDRGNLAYDATPGDPADHLFCATFAKDGSIDAIAYVGTPSNSEEFAFTPCTSR